MVIAFLLNDYQIVPIYRTAARIISVVILGKTGACFQEKCTVFPRFYIVFAFSTFSMVFLQFCKWEKFKKPYSMRVCYASENVKHGYFNAFQKWMYRKCTAKTIFYKTHVFCCAKMGTFHHARHCGGGYGMLISFCGYPQQARIAADCLLCVMMNACSVSVCSV